jgi:Prealbumin-like fold domain/Putative peptidoglycan binding domain
MLLTVLVSEGKSCFFVFYKLLLKSRIINVLFPPKADQPQAEKKYMQKILSKFLSGFTVLSMLVAPMAIMPGTAFAASSINLSHNVPDECQTEGFEVTVSGTAIADAPPGQLEQYAAYIDWGDGNLQTVLSAGAFGSGHGTSTPKPYGPVSHTYSTAGNYTIIAKVFHTNPSGKDNPDAISAPVEICITPSATLTLLKNVVNDNGGTAVDSNFTLSASGPTPISGVEGSANVTNKTVTPGAYTLSESGGPAGYTASQYSCVKNNTAPVVSNSITIANGDVVTCTITNNDIGPTLTLNKTVTNNNGGSAVANDFQAKIDGNNVAWGVAVPVNAGARTASEVAVTGYTPSSWGGDCDADGSITLGLAENATCSITNDDNQAYVVVNVIVNNDNGGTATANNFLPTLNGNGVTDEASNPVNPGTYPVGTTTLPGYTASAWGGDCAGGNVTAVLGLTKTCTITFTDDAPSLTLNKELVQDGDVFHTILDFILSAVGPTPISGVDGSVAVTNAAVSAGEYTLSETGPSGYTASDWECTGGSLEGNSLSVALGEEVNCTITNNDNQAKLTVIKTVVTNDGGNANSNDFQIYVKDDSNNNVANSPAPGSASGTVYMLDAGDYTVSEIAIDGYVGSFSESNCASDGTITLLPGDDKTCIIVNDDVVAGLTLHKEVINNNGGTATASSFQALVDGQPVAWDSSLPKPAGTYLLAEVANVSGYEASSWSCDGGTLDGDSITIAEGELVVCTITNDDKAPSLTLVKQVINDNGGTANENAWTLTATGYDSESPDAGTYNLSESGGPIGYTQTSLTCSNSEGQVTSVTLGLDEDVTCVFVNDDNKPSLTLTKIVDNQLGGDADAEDWTLSASGDNDFLLQGTSPVTSGALFPAGTYTLSESTGPANYNPAAFWICEGGTMNEAGTQVTLALGESADCSITNTYVPVVYECSDGVDTEGEADELADENDPGCHTDKDVNNPSSYVPTDDDESNDATECSDGVNNNDIDNLVDSNDPACHTDGDADDEDDTYNPDDNDEATECSDEVDNTDGEDSFSDANDPGCHSDGDADNEESYEPNDPTESNDALPQCSDDVNNSDNDELVDANDPDCHTDGDPDNEDSYDPSDDNEDNDEDNSNRSSGGGRRSGGEVLGAATEICNWNTQYLRRGWNKNVPGDVQTMQNFLNIEMTSGLAVDSVFGPLTEAAVKAFQAKYKADILTPWGINSPTGIWYLSTTTKAKEIMCGEKTALPQLINWSQNPAVR